MMPTIKPEPEPEPTIELFMVEVRVVDWAASARWYVDIMGLRAILQDAEHQFLLLAAGAGRVALKAEAGSSAGAGAGTSSADRGAVRLIFQVPDVDEARERLVGLGVAVTATTRSAEGYREVRLRDPEGLPIHLFAWVEVAGGSPLGVFSSPVDAQPGKVDGSSLPSPD